MRVRMGDRVYEGTALQIVQGMKSGAPSALESVYDYLTWAAARAKELERVDLAFAGATDEALAETFLASCLASGMATKL